MNKNRANYKRKFSDSGKCVFCSEDETLECSNLSGKYWRVLVNRFPYMDGNVMLVPARHIEKTEEISSEEWEDFGIILSKTQKVLSEIFKTESFNVGLNIGPESGASIPHIHWQVIPRKFKNITVVNTFADLHVVVMTPEEIKRIIDETVEKQK